MAKRKDGKEEWREPGSGLSGCGEGLSCLVELVGCGLGCMVPTMVLLMIIGLGVSSKAKPVQRFGANMVARIQGMRQKSIRRFQVIPTSRRSRVTFSSPSRCC